MAYAVLETNLVDSTNRSILKRTVVSGSNIENAMIFRADSLSSGSGQGEVFDATQVATGSLVNVWMANNPVIPQLTSADGEVFRMGSEDPRNYLITAGQLIDAFKPQPGDIVTFSEDCFSGARGSNTYANATTGAWQMVWGTSQGASAMCFKYLATTYISIGNPAVASGRVTAYKMECLAN